MHFRVEAHFERRHAAILLEFGSNVKVEIFESFVAFGFFEFQANVFEEEADDQSV